MQPIRKEPDKGKAFKDHDFHHFLSFHDERRPKIGMVLFQWDTRESKNLFDKFVGLDCQVISWPRTGLYCDKSKKKQFLRPWVFQESSRRQVPLECQATFW